MDPVFITTPATAGALAGLLYVMLRKDWISLEISYFTKRLGLRCRIGKPIPRR